MANNNWYALQELENKGAFHYNNAAFIFPAHDIKAAKQYADDFYGNTHSTIIIGRYINPITTDIDECDYISVRENGSWRDIN